MMTTFGHDTSVKFDGLLTFRAMVMLLYTKYSSFVKHDIFNT